MDNDKYPRIIIQTRLANDRRRVHHVKQARIRSAGSAAAARNGHKQEVCVLIMLSRHASGQAEVQPQPVTDTNRKYVYGIPGIARLFGCSLPTANRIKKSGKIDKAITQIGRKIIVDAELALELAGKKTGGRK